MSKDPKPLILIVDDAAPIRNMISLNLQLAGFRYCEAEDEASLYAQLTQARPDLILLDWMLPGRSGIEIAKALKKSTTHQEIPVIMLTAKAEVENKIKGLKSGSDDYMIKPFSPKELIARIETVLRRYRKNDEDGTIHFSGFCLNTYEQTASFAEKTTTLTSKDYQLIHFFITHPKRIYHRQQILDYVWGTGTFLEERTIDVQVRRLRLALAKIDAEHFLHTIHGSGYRFAAPSP